MEPLLLSVGLLVGILTGRNLERRGRSDQFGELHSQITALERRLESHETRSNANINACMERQKDFSRHLSNLEDAVIADTGRLEEVIAEHRKETAQSIAAATEGLIPRSEVQEAFAKVAQIEAQRIQSERAAQERARAQSVFGAQAMPPDMNRAINGQLAALNERLQQIGASMPAM